MKASSFVLSASLKQLYPETAEHLKGSARRHKLATVVRELGVGGQTLAEQALGWHRGTLRKGLQELRSGLSMVEAFALRGRKPIATHLPHRRSEIPALVEPSSQADPTLNSLLLETRSSAAAVRRRLIAQKGYSDTANISPWHAPLLGWNHPGGEPCWITSIR